MAPKDTAKFFPLTASRAHGRRILLAWELGEGFGHAARLLLVATRLKAQGWSPVVAARHPRALAQRYAAAGIPVIAAPAHTNCFAGPGSFQAASYADVMGVCGYADAARLSSVVSAWDSLLTQVAPAVVIADYAPLLSLAAFGRVPVIAIGDGFVTPHGLPDGRFPPMRENAAPVWEPGALLANARQVQAARGLRLPETLPQIIEGAGQVVSVLPELDIYGGTRPAPAAGPWEVPQPLSAAPVEPHVFCYLHIADPLARVFLQVLLEQRIAGECYLREAPASLVAQAEEAGMQIHASPPPLRQALLRSTLLVHHGGIGSMEEAVLAGRPQLLLPRHLEHSLNARCAVTRFRGTLALRPGATIEGLRHKLPALLGQAEPLRLAQQAATRLAGRRATAWTALEHRLQQVLHSQA